MNHQPVMGELYETVSSVRNPTFRAWRFSSMWNGGVTGWEYGKSGGRKAPPFLTDDS